MISPADAGRSARASRRAASRSSPPTPSTGSACDPENAAAVARLYALKGRPPEKPAAVMFFDLALALGGAADRARVTLLLPDPERRCPLACADPARRRSGCACPFLAPVGAAGPAVAREPRRRARRAAPERRAASIRAGADLVIDGGELPGTPSTVIDLRDVRGRRRVGDPARGRRRREAEIRGTL